jgi:hypothetical protein
MYLFWSLLIIAPSSSLNINDGDEQWHHCNNDNDDKKEESFEKKQIPNISKGVG